MMADFQGAPPGPSSPFHKVVPRSFDALATQPAWTEAKEARLAEMQAIRPTRGAALVASAKNEGIYILEWLAHHRAVGFEHFFIYTNDNADGSDALLDLLAHHGCVTVLRNETGPGASPQVRAYEHSILHLPELRAFEWAAYFDLDEFLVPSAQHGHSVAALTAAAKAQHPHRAPDAIYIHWRWFGSGGRVAREPGLVRQQFVHSAPHTLVKSLVRLQTVRSMRKVHVPEAPDLFAVDAALRPKALTEQFTSAPDYSGGQLNHYYHKSFAEFCVKHNRGSGSSSGGTTGKPVGTFFQWDVPATDAARDPVPHALLVAGNTALAEYHALPGMAAVLQHVEEQHRRLEERATGNDVASKYRMHTARKPVAPPDAASLTPVTCLPDLTGDHHHTMLRRLHAVLQPQTYLELGVSNGATLALASCDSIGVDTDFQLDNLPALVRRPTIGFYQMTSDAFFARHDPAALLQAPVDMAFLDGMHHCEFLLRDFAHTERSCRRGSLIVMHDCLPVEAAIATRTPGQTPSEAPHRRGWWTGDVWRFALLLRRRRPDLDLNVVDSNPTGLVLATNLSPRDTTLLDNYAAHVAEMLSWDLSAIGLDRLFDELQVQPTASLTTAEQIKVRYRL